MKERPILFSAPMVRAILDGSKTQTRRIVKPQPFIDEMGNFCWNGMNFGQDFDGPHIQAIASPLPSSRTKRVHCPYGKRGDRLWVRETWMPGYDHEADHENGPQVSILYRADNEGRTVAAPNYELAEQWELEYSEDGDPPPSWRPSIHMPRWASRITLEITGVRVERLRDISEANCLAEGCTGGHGSIPGYSYNATPSEYFQHIWTSINGAGNWDANPWVWVVEFRRVDK